MDLSCAAKKNKMYVVVGLLEKEVAKNKSEIYRNTAVVFDRNGTVILK